MTRTHGWTFTPDDGPARLIRFVHGDTSSSGNVLAMVIKDKNIVLVAKHLFDALDDLDQGRVLATNEDLYVKERGGRLSIR